MTSPPPSAATDRQVLKRDLFGRVERRTVPGGSSLVARCTGDGAWWVRPLARWLAVREATALQRLAAVDGVPRLLSWSGGELQRSWLEGLPMQEVGPTDRRYFRAARQLVVRLHRHGVAHNDLAKEPNWLVTEAGLPALVDFQLAQVTRGRGRLFRLLAREDLRHLLKHKRTYCPEALTQREKHILATPSWPSRLWRMTGKRLYLMVTRGLLGWQDREGAGDRSTEASRTP